MKLSRRVRIAIRNKENDMATEDDLTILKLHKKVKQINELAGVVVMKEFDDGLYKGWVMDRDKHGFLVEYEDGDSEYLTAEEVYQIMYTPSDDQVSLCDHIDSIYESGNKAKSFVRVCNEMVNNRPYLVQKLADIYIEMGYTHMDIKKDPNDEEEEFTKRDIDAHLWPLLGECEKEKFYVARRILEKLYYHQN
jgi:hypothetical protein